MSEITKPKYEPKKVHLMKGEYYDSHLKRAPWATAMVQDEDGELWFTDGKRLWSFPTDCCCYQPVTLEIIE